MLQFDCVAKILSVACLVCAGMTLSSPANAQDYKQGDKVHVEMPGGISGTAVIQEKRSGQFYRVEFLDGKWAGRTVPVVTRYITPLGGASKPSVAPAMKPVASPFQPAAKPDFREWTDSSGQFKIEARLVQVQNGQVTIQRKDGQSVAFPLERLSAADQAYVAAQGAGPPAPTGFQVGDKVEVQWGSKWWNAQIKELKPGQTKVSYEGWAASNDEWVGPERIRKPGAPTPLAKQPASGPSAVGAIQTVPADRSSVQQLAGGRSPQKSAFEPDAEAGVSVRADPIVLKGKKDRFFESPTCLSLVPGRSQAMISYVNGPPGKPKTTRFEFCDLQGGTVAEGPTISEELRVFGLSPDGAMLLTRNTKFGFGESRRIDIWKVDGLACERVKSWEPYAEAKKTERDVTWAAWVDGQHFLTMNSAGTLVLWQAAVAKAIYQLETGRARNTPALSANRKQVAVAAESGVEVLDALTGNVLLRLSSDAPHSARLGFRSDGRALALLTSGRMQIWDLPSGTKLDDVSVPGVTSPGRVDWVDDEFVLVSSQFLVAVGRHCVIWNYGAAPAKAEACGLLGGHFWYVATEGDRQSLVPVQLPHDQASNAAQALGPDAYAVAPGKSVSLDIKVPVDVEPLQRIQSSLRAKLEESGFAVGSGGNIKLVARTEQGEESTISYRSFRSFGRRGGQEVTVRAVINLLEILVDGQTVWQRKSVTSAPHFLQMQEGETVEQAVKRSVQPNVSFFTNEWIPVYVPKPELANNKSKLAISGVRPG